MKLYEPLGTPKPFGEGLWIVDGPIESMPIGPLRIPFPTRMAIARLRSGELFLWSPVAFDDALDRSVRALGPVRHLVSPNRLHYAHIAAWKRAHPDAIAWASPGVRERARSQRIDVAFDRDLADASPPEWPDEIDHVLVAGSRFVEEFVFFHRPSRTALVADLVQRFEREKLRPSERLVARAAGILDPEGGTPRDFRATFVGRRRLAGRALAQVLAWEPERAVIAHGRCYEANANEGLARAFDWAVEAFTAHSHQATRAKPV